MTKEFSFKPAEYRVQEVEEKLQMEPAPRGWYLAKILEAEYRVTKEEKRQLALTFCIVEGKYTGKNVGYYVYIDPTDAISIGGGPLSKLADICEALGIAEMRNPSELCGGLIEIELGFCQMAFPGAPSNVIDAFRSVGV